MMTYVGFKSNAIPFIGKPETLDTDSPLGWSGNGTAGQLSTRFATEPVIAATWNKELAYEMGKMIGDQGLWGRSDTGTAVKAYWSIIAAMRPEPNRRIRSSSSETKNCDDPGSP